MNLPDEYRVRAIDVITSDAEFADVLSRFHDTIGVARF